MAAAAAAAAMPVVWSVGLVPLSRWLAGLLLLLLLLLPLAGLPLLAWPIGWPRQPATPVGARRRARLGLGEQQ